LQDERPVILFSGRIHSDKQPPVLAETMLKLKQNGLAFNAWIAGDGPDLEWLRAFMNQHNLHDVVQLLGAVSNQRVKDLMAAADVFFLPSLWEGIALSMFEAMACGLPVVGADVGGQRELVTPECGILVPRSDVATEATRYAQVLTELLQDPERRRKMGCAARQRVQAHFRLEQMGERMDALLKEAMRLHVEQPRPTPPLGLGRAYVSQALEYAQLGDQLEQLWRQQQQSTRPVTNSRLIDPDAARWRTLVYYTITRFPLRYYWNVLKRSVRKRGGK
jgi:hypothetical protein